MLNTYFPICSTSRQIITQHQSSLGSCAQKTIIFGMEVSVWRRGSSGSGRHRGRGRGDFPTASSVSWPRPRGSWKQLPAGLVLGTQPLTFCAQGSSLGTPCPGAEWQHPGWRVVQSRLLCQHRTHPGCLGVAASLNRAPLPTPFRKKLENSLAIKADRRYDFPATGKAK